MNLTDMVLDDGVPVPVSQHIESDDTTANDNLFIVRLRTPSISKDKGVEYPTSLHIFTEKELIRSTVRYYNDLDEILETGNIELGKTMLGYIGVRTYNNKNDVLTTRFVIRFDGSKLPSSRSDNCVGLFTARELKRSKDRIEWLTGGKFKWFKSLWYALRRKSHVPKHAC